MVGRIKAHRRAYVARQVSIASVALLLIALSIYASIPTRRPPVAGPAEQAKNTPAPSSDVVQPSPDAEQAAAEAEILNAQVPVRSEVPPQPHYNCAKAWPLLRKFIDHQLTDPEAAQVKYHVQKCKWCRKIYTAMGGPPLVQNNRPGDASTFAEFEREEELQHLVSTPWMSQR